MILIVDDQKNMCWILSRALTEAGFAVVTAATAAEALTLAKEGGISAAVIDYRLPDQSGVALFKALRQHQLTLPAVLITSYGSIKLRSQALHLGFYSYMDKPVDNHTLIVTLRKALNPSLP